MKKILKKVTDETINELLQNEIILPSTYFQSFDKHAKILDLNLEDEEFHNNLDSFIAKEYEDINNYAKRTLESLHKVKNVTKDAKIAIENKDESTLQQIYHQMDELKKELDSVSNKIFRDDVTKAFNKKWIYNIFLDTNNNFKKDGILALLTIENDDYIYENYGQLIFDNLQIFLIKYITRKIKEEKLNYSIARFIKNKFIIFFDEENIKECTNILNNLKKLIDETTLKSKSGILIKPNFSFEIATYNKKDSFTETIDSSFKNL
ncbi:hypothetical protein CPU12_06330 [Malaciobacter molluscorum LMG 25693]|uniref:GGDEF domain-containing protein n=1 Tax=Malaciobacter molluscorum LMG 25693 TaxID=870501 RepID=A0A2G1DIU1_9BACT|nr:hypothetical protein [Malaciobacter molluscorum]AXX91931.1 hypothetical protein AMOL_0939 [Malaciobacter molluscorum LMG 25693]PHO18334.1 hypothetical protein CPU12_06330 [Malaciobacter molluscorum LMG 25693]